MYVCLCYGISDKTIKRLVDEGCHSTREIQAQCGAGQGCGECLFELRRLVEEQNPQRSSKKDGP